MFQKRRFLFGFLICSHLHAAVLIKGTAISCELGHKSPVVVDVYILDSAKAPRLVALIKMIERGDPGNDQQSIQLIPRFDEMMRIVKSTTPLAHMKTDRAGSFRSKIPSVGDVIVFGYAEVEDHPYFYEYKQVTVSGQSSIDVTLDFGHYCSSVR
jgi:hypothetical protein